MIGYLRYTDYYGMTSILESLYESSKDGKNFTNIYEKIVSSNNIMLAYRTIKSNKGSLTTGIDGKPLMTTKNYLKKN